MVEDRKKAALDAIGKQLKELGEILDRAKSDRDMESAWERRDRWKERTSRVLAEKVSSREAHRFSQLRKGSFIMGNPERNFVDEIKMYKGFFAALGEEIQQHGDDVLGSRSEANPVPVPAPRGERVVFIIHGHDELNTLRLQKLLKEQWHIESIILSGEPGRGRTLIEKFEQEAQRADYALALMTPDDFILVSDGEYAQARPNVIFEIGWFYGRLGRERVTILFRKGTKIHSDLDGIQRIEFEESISEKVADLHRELSAVGLL